MRFAIEFHGPFRVGTGLAGRGVDDSVDRDAPLTASSLKGVMRAAARAVLPERPDLVAEVFGREGDGSPWSWSDAEVEGPIVRRRARISIDDDTGTVDEGALGFQEEIWADRATFSVDLREPVARERKESHQLVLAVSAHAVQSIGAQRRRGLGWVTMTALDPVLDRAAVDRLVELRRAPR